MGKYKFTVISLFIILLAAIPLIILSNRGKKEITVQTVTPSPMLSPTMTPLSPQNADSTFNSADTQMQQATTQMDQDLQSVNQIDTTQDSTNGL